MFPYFDRFDICEAYYCLEYDYNVSGALQERLKDSKRKMSVGYQLYRMSFKPSQDLSYDTLSENGQAIYDQFVSSHNLPTE